MDFERNNLHLDNDDDLLKDEEFNTLQSGNEYFQSGQERFYSGEENKIPDEEISLSSEKEKKESTIVDKKPLSSAASSVGGGVASSIGAAISIPVVAASLVASILVIGGSAGLITPTPSDHVSIFMARSTELGFEINKDKNKTYTMLLTNEDQDYTQEVTFTNQFIFEDLLPNTSYDLKVYDTSVDPMKLVFSSNYKTKEQDNYHAAITESKVVDDLLTLDVNYEGENINFVTIEVLGDNNEVLYRYEGAPIDQLTVNVAGHSNVSCSISINGEMTHFEQLLVEHMVIPVDSVSLNESALTLEVGGSEKLLASILPENATDKAISWSSSDASVASVDNDGLVSALKVGNATITATTNDGNKVATCTVTVNEAVPVVHVTSISLDKEELGLKVGDKYTFVTTILPENASDKSVTWVSESSSVVSVSNGVITALKTGTAKIVVTTNDGELSASCLVTVSEGTIPVNGVSLDIDSVNFKVGETKQLTATVLPKTATNKEVSWKSANEAVVSVDEQGLITAIGVGQTIVTVKTNEGGYQDYCIVTVGE